MFWCLKSVLISGRHLKTNHSMAFVVPLLYLFTYKWESSQKSRSITNTVDSKQLVTILWLITFIYKKQQIAWFVENEGSAAADGGSRLFLAKLWWLVERRCPLTNSDFFVLSICGLRWGLGAFGVEVITNAFSAVTSAWRISICHRKRHRNVEHTKIK